MIFRPSLWPSLICLSIFITTIYLGIWQYKRSIWKNNILGELSEKWEHPPENIISDFSSLEEYSYIKINGEFLSKPIFFKPTTYKKRHYYEVVAPFKTDKKIIPTAVGFVKLNQKDNFKMPDRNISLYGVIKYSKIENDKILKNHSLIADIPFKTFNYYFKDKVPKFSVMVTTPTKYSDILVRNPKDFLSNIPNNHFFYMMQWFFFAAIIVIIYFAWHIKAGRLYKKI